MDQLNIFELRKGMIVAAIEDQYSHDAKLKRTYRVEKGEEFIINDLDSCEAFLTDRFGDEHKILRGQFLKLFKIKDLDEGGLK